MFRPNLCWLILGAVMDSAEAAQVWTVRLEEPTAIERRIGEVVRVPLESLRPAAPQARAADSAYRVLDRRGAEVPSQLTTTHLLFPADVMAGQVAEYRVVCCSAPLRQEPRVTVRRMPSGRIEVKSSAVRLVLDPETGAIREAYHLGAGPQRIVNLVETTPATYDPYDIHPAPQRDAGPGSPVGGGNDGWLALGGSGSGDWTLASGAVEGLARRGDVEFRLAGNLLWWTAPGGFRFSSISAQPYLPYDRCTDGDEYHWPTGPDPSEPPGSAIGARQWRSPPGGMITYYARKENYGAISLVEPGTPPLGTLAWIGACSHRLEARAKSAAASLVIVFHDWKGDETPLAGRSEGRKVRRPLLVSVSASSEESVRMTEPLTGASEVKIAAVAGPPAPFTPPRVLLDGDWQLAWGEKGQGPSSEWRSVRVPGSVHLQWLPPEKVYTREAGWVSDKEWWYRRTVHIPEQWKDSRIHLDFEATDYFAEAFLDGVRLGRHEGYIDPYSYDVTAHVKPGRQYELKVRVWTPVHYYWKHRPYTVKGSYGGVDQKPDDITAAGITRSVWLRASQGTRIAEVAIETDIGQNDGVVVAHLTAEGLPQGATWELTLTPHTFRGAGVQLTAPAARRRERFELRVAKPRLWWTWDHGKPDLYLLDIRLKDAAGRVLAAERLRTGIRTIARRGDRFYVNGKPVFLRGTNIYANLFLSEFRRPQYERDLALIRQMNVNAIRVHCHFENPEFYELADEQGFLIWQDFLEAWYPHDTDFSRHAAKLFDRHIRMVRNHASVFAWAPSDEEDFENYRDLSKHLAARPALLDPQDRWVQRSTGRYGDTHLYYGWYSGSIWDYRRMTANLVTELGATALPAEESLAKFLPGKWPIPDYAEDWRFHRLQIPEAENAWGDLRKLTVSRAVEVSQSYAARLFQIALERSRRRKEEGAGGIFHFFAIDMWPSVTMSAVDFYRVPSKVHATVARSFAPVAVSIDFDRAEWKPGETVRVALWAINDLHREVPNAEIRWQAAGAAGTIPCAFPPDSSRKVADVEWRAAAVGSYVLRASVWSNGRLVSENLYEYSVAGGGSEGVTR